MIKLRSELPGLLTAKGYKIGIELGVRRGDFSKVLLEHSSLDKLFSIDRWSGDRGHNIDEYITTINKLYEYGSRSCIIKLTFEEAYELFPDEFFDFIYIDGYAGQDYETQAKTINSWWSKVAPGGLYTGHDYYNKYPELIKTVDEFVSTNKLKLYVTDDVAGTWLITKEKLND